LRLEAGNVMRGRSPIMGPVWVSLLVYLPIPSSWSKKRQYMALEGQIKPTTKPDLDNTFKLSADACNGIVWHDDKQIVEASVAKFYSDRPRLVLTVKEV